MAYNIGNDVNTYLRVGAHYIVTADGQVAQLYDDFDYLNASNDFNPRSIAIEFAGNFPDNRYRWWRDRDSTSPLPDRCYVTPAQIRAGRCLLSTLKARLPTIKYLYAHRQSSKDREGDPGPDVWFNIGEWALSNLNLTDRLPRTYVGTGQPIPDAWRRGRPRTS
jgi:N-acetyl-anhydromuramyl-L-alanine amidase AmpD